MPGEQLLAGAAQGAKQNAAIGLTGLIGGIQFLSGKRNAKRANAELERLFSQRKAYQTPQEIFDILQMSENNAQSGYSDETLAYLTSGADVGLSSTLGAATKLGADPNQLSGVVDSYFRDIFKIGGENELLKLKKFDSLSNALQLVAQNKEAEFISQENLIKDRMQAEASKVDAARKDITSGLNLGLNALSSFASSNAYGAGGAGGSSATMSPVSTGNTLSGLGGLTPSQLLKLKEQQALGLND